MPSLCEKHLGQVLQLSGIMRNHPCRVGDSGLHAEVESTLSRWSTSQWLEAYWSGWSGWSSSNWADSCFATGHFLVTGMLVLSRNSAKEKVSAQSQFSSRLSLFHNLSGVYFLPALFQIPGKCMD